MQKDGISGKEPVTGGKIEGFVRPAERVEAPDKEKKDAKACQDIGVYML